MNDFAVESYRPSDAEPFMNERQREYFRRKLIAWRESILAESRGVHVRFKSYIDVQRSPYRAGKIKLPPSCFRSGSNVTKRRRLRIRIDGPERANADRSQPASPEKVHSPVNRFLWQPRRKFVQLKILRIASNGANKLRSARFDGPI